MARAIDAEYVEKIFEKWLDNIPDGEETPAIEACLNGVRNAPTLTPPNEWVSAKDNPPQLTGKYICCVEDTHGHMWSIPADYLLEMKTWVGEFGEIKNKVVSWMPLPSPPDRRQPEGVE